MHRSIAVLAAGLLTSGAALAQTTACIASPPVNRCGEDPSLYTNLTYPGATPSHLVFCGKDALWASSPNSLDFGFPSSYNSASVGGWEIDSSGNCYSSHGGSAGAFNSKILATVVELRGWVVSPPNASFNATSSLDTTDGEQEYKFYVALDSGWTPAPSVVQAGVVPLNTLSAINHYVPATNTIQFGGRSLKSTQEAWGGMNTAIVHVEVNAWGPARGEEAFGTHWTEAPTKPTQNRAQMFTGWTPGTYQGTTQIWWPFPPLQLHTGDNVSSIVSENSISAQYGDYVRIVGTLWEDEPHLTTDSDFNGAPDRLAKQCWWKAYNAGHGWAEIHSADYISVIKPPVSPHIVSSYVMCADSGDTPSIATMTDKAFPPPFYELSRLTAVNSDLDSTPGANQNLTTQVPLAWSPANPFFTINEATANAGSTPGTFKMAIESVMSCTPTCNDRCGSDGCGGTCSNNCNAAIGHACPGSGACTCSAPGWSICSSTGGDCRTTASCPSCPLGVSTNVATIPVLWGGSSNNITATATGGGGAQTVNLSASGLPFGTSISFSPSQLSVAAGSPATSAVTILANTQSSPGSFPFTVINSAAPPPAGSTCSPATYTATMKITCPTNYRDCGDGTCTFGKICH